MYRLAKKIAKSNNHFLQAFSLRSGTHWEKTSDEGSIKCVDTGIYSVDKMYEKFKNKKLM